MKTYRLDEMKAGWFVGNFEPSCLRTEEFEVACKSYRAGDSEGRHIHRLATEITLVATGRVRINGQTLIAGEIFVLDPGEPADFCALQDVVTVVVKKPSVPGDKYPVGGGDEQN
jgi:hypothetical protein